MAREKRGFDSSSNGDGNQPDRKRPALASVIVEALKVDSLQKLCSSLEPILRKVVSEEVERALAKLGSARLTGRSSPKRIVGGVDGKNLQLHFRSKLSLPLFTGGRVEGELGTGILVVLIDANSGHVVTSGPESSVKLDVVVLEGDFSNEDDGNWTPEEFESHVVKEREGKRPLLNGDLQVTLKEGVGTLGELAFTDNSSWIRSRKFRLGLKVASGQCEGVRIREAKTDAFTVKDHRGELYKKHYPPALRDEVWRLEKIGKDGSFHKRLNKAGIFSVEDFLRLVVRDSPRLRTILGSGMSNKMWDALIEHAKTCALSGKLYVYYPEDSKNVGVVFNNIYELSGLIANGQYHSAESLSENQKVYVDVLVKKAYENWSHVLEYDSKTLLDFNPNGNIVASETGNATGQQNFFNSLDQQVSLPALSGPILSEQHAIDTGPIARGYDDNMAGRFSMHGNVSSPFQFNAGTSHQPVFQRSDDLLAQGPLQSSTLNFEGVLTPSFREPEHFIHEEEIRMRSHEMLENEDMQNLLRIFNMGNQGLNSFGSNEDSFHFQSPYLPVSTPHYSFGGDPGRSSGKAVIGWLKLKAALRWGIFVRRKAAERRAQIIELDD